MRASLPQSLRLVITGTQRGVIPFTDWVNRADHISPDALPNCPWEKKVTAEFTRNKDHVGEALFHQKYV